MDFNSTVAQVLSDFMINLAAGWFGAIIIVPSFAGLKGFHRWFVLTSDLILGIVSLMIAVALRRISV